MLTARGDDFDVVVGLEAGADDYIVKPARTEVIEARIRAVLRRIEEPGTGRSAVEFHGELAIDRAGLTVAKAGERLALAPSELKLLLHLTAAPEQVFSRQQLLEHVWEHSYHGDARLVDACVRRLRNKIEDTPGEPRYIQTLRGFGYRFGPL
jgi:DNA-binding response OmpR family regulator